MAGQRTAFNIAMFFLIAVFAVHVQGAGSSGTPHADDPKVRWDFLIYEKTVRNPAIGSQNRDSRAAESLALSCEIEMSDPRLLLGIVPGVVIERITDARGNELNVGLGDFRSAGMYRQDSFLIHWLKFNQRIGGPRTAGGKTRRSPPRLDLDSRLREQAKGGIKLIKGHYTGLMAESIEYVDVPFRANDEWVRITPELQIRVLEARNAGSMHHYKIEQRSPIEPFPSTLSVGDPIPKRLVLAEQIVVRNNSGVGGGGGMRGSEDGKCVSKGSGIGRAEKIRYVIAINPAHKKIPFELKDISLSALAGPSENSEAPAQARSSIKNNRGKYFNIRWTSITHMQRLYNPAFSKRGLDQTLKLHCDAEILDPELVLGTCETPIIEKVTDGKGRPVDIRPERPRSRRMYYKTPEYRKSGPATPPSTLAQMEGKARLALGLPLRERHWPQRASKLQPVRMVIELDPGLIGQERKEITHVKGFLQALTAESFKNVEVPFKSSNEWVRLTSNVEIQVARAWHDGSTYRFDIKERSRTPIRPGRMSINIPLPDGIVVSRRFAGPGVPEKDRSIVKGGDSIPMSPGGRGSISYGPDSKIKTISYRIAVNPKHLKIPFQFEHIPLP